MQARPGYDPAWFQCWNTVTKNHHWDVQKKPNIGRCGYELFFTVNANARSNGLKLYKTRFNSNTRKFSFSQRIINDWNSLPNNVVTAPNVFIKQN